ERQSELFAQTKPPFLNCLHTQHLHHLMNLPRPSLIHFEAPMTSRAFFPDEPRHRVRGELPPNSLFDEPHPSEPLLLPLKPTHLFICSVMHWSSRNSSP